MLLATATAAATIAVATAGCTDPYNSTRQPKAASSDDASNIEHAVRAAARHRAVDPDVATPGVHRLVITVTDRDGAGTRRRLLVVVREDGRYRVTLAIATKSSRDNWRITDWQPQP